MSDLDWEFDEVVAECDSIEEIAELADGEYYVTRVNEYDKLYFLVQRLTGLLMVICSIAVALITGDGTGPFMCIVLGIVLIFTNEKALFFGFGTEYDDDF